MPSGSTYASMRLCSESAPNKVDFGVQGGAWVRCHVAAVIGLHGGHMVGSRRDELLIVWSLCRPVAAVAWCRAHAPPWILESTSRVELKWL